MDEQGVQMYTLILGVVASDRPYGLSKTAATYGAQTFAFFWGEAGG